MGLRLYLQSLWKETVFIPCVRKLYHIFALSIWGKDIGKLHLEGKWEWMVRPQKGQEGGRALRVTQEQQTHTHTAQMVPETRGPVNVPGAHLRRLPSLSQQPRGVIRTGSARLHFAQKQRFRVRVSCLKRSSYHWTQAWNVAVHWISSALLGAPFC